MDEGCIISRRLTFPCTDLKICTVIFGADEEEAEETEGRAEEEEEEDEGAEGLPLPSSSLRLLMKWPSIWARTEPKANPSTAHEMSRASEEVGCIGRCEMAMGPIGCGWWRATAGARDNQAMNANMGMAKARGKRKSVRARWQPRDLQQLSTTCKIGNRHFVANASHVCDLANLFCFKNNYIYT